MKKFLLALALLLTPTIAAAQCSGVFPAHTICGNNAASPNVPGQVPTSVLTGIPGGSNGQIQYNNSGAFGGFTAGGDLTFSVPNFTISNNAVSNAKLATMPANTIKGSVAGGTPSDLTPTQAQGILAMNAPSAVGGRLTLTTGTPVMPPSTVSGATTVYFSPYKGRSIPLWNGTTFVWQDYGGELSQATTDTTKSPAAVVASKNYDIFVWLDGSTYRATRGPPWSTDTSRGTGAGTTQISLVNGIYTNTVAITNGPAAGFGTYVGSIRSNGTSTIDWIGWGAGTQAGVLGVWNYFNRVLIINYEFDTGASYTYTSTTGRQARASTQNQISFIVGVGEDSYDIWYQAFTTTVATTFAHVLFGIGVGPGLAGSTTFACGTIVDNPATNAFTSAGNCTWASQTVAGFYTAMALEAGDGVNANSFAVFGGNQLTFKLPM